MANIPVVKEFNVKQAKLTEKLRVEFDCPHCAGDLVIQEAELTDQQESCPNCGQFFVMSPAASQQIKAHYDARWQREQEDWQAQEDRLAAGEEDEKVRGEQAKRQASEQAEAQILKKKQRGSERWHSEAQAQILQNTQRESEREKDELTGITGTWKDRYKNLALYLVSIKNLVETFFPIIGILFAVAGIVITSNALNSGSAGIGALFAVSTVTILLLLRVLYVVIMASIELVYMFCNLEQETVISRLALQKLVKHFQ